MTAWCGMKILCPVERNVYVTEYGTALTPILPILHFQQYFSYIMAISFSGGGSRNIHREPPTLGKQLVNFITCGCESSAPFFCNLQSWARTHAILGYDGRKMQFYLVMCCKASNTDI
jgi:hypothetical protein